MAYVRVKLSVEDSNTERTQTPETLKQNYSAALDEFANKFGVQITALSVEELDSETSDPD